MKKIVLFILLEFIWTCLLVGALLLYHNNLSPRESYATTITIKSGNPLDYSLILDPDANIMPLVCRWRRVNWKIDPSSNVEFFRIEKKDKSEQIFTVLDRPPSNHTTQGGGTVDPLSRDKKEYSYSIFWKMKGDTTERRFDPKLAVKSAHFAPVVLIIYIVYGILFLATFGVLRSSRTRSGS